MVIEAGLLLQGLVFTLRICETCGTGVPVSAFKKTTSQNESMFDK